MGVDFSKLVLGPCQTVLGRAVLIDPRASGQSGDEPYPARGIYSSMPVEVMMEGGGVVSDQRTTLGIKLNDTNQEGGAMFPAPVIQSDRVSIDDGVSWYRVADTNDDGQGGRVLTLANVVSDD